MPYRARRGLWRTAAAGLFLACLVGVGPAAAQSAGSDGDSASDRSTSGAAAATPSREKLAKRLKELESRVSALADALAQGGGNGDSGNVAAELQVRLSRLERSVREMTGQFQEVRHRVDRVRQRLDTLIGDIDYRLNELETQLKQTQTRLKKLEQQGPSDPSAPEAPSSPSASTDGGSGSAQAAASQAAQQSGQVAQQSAQAAQQGSQTAQQGAPTAQKASQTAGQAAASGASSSGTSQAGGNAGSKTGAKAGNEATGGDSKATAGGSAAQGSGGSSTGDSGGNASASANAQLAGLPTDDPKAFYEAAFDLLGQQDYAKAERAFKAFVKRYADHSLADNAQYWLGETYYVRQNYSQAAVAFAQGYQDYPESGKAADNLLKLGISLAALDRPGDACIAFDELRSNFADAPSRLLDRAAREAKKLNCKQVLKNQSQDSGPVKAGTGQGQG